MLGESIDAGESMGKGTSAHILADEIYCVTLSEDFGIAFSDVEDALLGEPMKRAYKICAWVESLEDAKSPLQRGQALTRWAKKNRAGVYANRSRGPEGGPTKTPERKERTRFSNEQIARNLDRMSGGAA
jgi:hypothetical protein